MIDLEPYVGKKCLVQFAAGDQWLAVHADDSGQPALVGFPVEIEEKGVKKVVLNMVPSPYMIGIIEKLGNGHALCIEDPSKSKLQVGLNPDKLLSVTVVTEAVTPSRIVLS